MMLSVVLIGSAAVATGAFGMRLPAGDRIAAALALVVGAGVGLVALAIGTRISNGSPESQETVFLVASAFGFVATLAGLGVMWRRTEPSSTTRER